MSIADFIADKMSAYIAGGINPETAAHFMRGELLAVYKGGHYSRDTSGAMRVTPPPEALDIEAAIIEILKCYDEKGPSQSRETRLRGFEHMAEYTRGRSA